MYQIKEKEKIFIYTGPDGSGRKTDCENGCYRV